MYGRNLPLHQTYAPDFLSTDTAIPRSRPRYARLRISRPFDVLAMFQSLTVAGLVMTRTP